MEADLIAGIPLLWKLGYSAFMAVLIPVYLRAYGPTNFVYFCDVALLLTLAGMWTENALLLSTATVGILLPQLFWLVDFVAGMVGLRLSGMTAYMFDRTRPLGLRALSLFHGWLPVLLVLVLLRTGYDPRALLCWTAIASALLPICYFLLPPPSPQHGRRPVNINYVYGLADDRPQSWVPAPVWFSFTLIGFPVLLYCPAHVLLRWLMPEA
jgi:hypothetical protein